MPIEQTVLYTPNPRNPDAEKMIVENAHRILGVIEGVRLEMLRSIPTSRDVVISNGTVLKRTTWETEEDMRAYFKHPNLRTWCVFVLKGWMLQGSNAGDPQDEFINHILTGGEKRQWQRNPQIPEEEVVWESERIILCQRES